MAVRPSGLVMPKPSGLVMPKREDRTTGPHLLCQDLVCQDLVCQDLKSSLIGRTDRQEGFLPIRLGATRVSWIHRIRFDRGQA
jgi:hypothetical protein